MDWAEVSRWEQALVTTLANERRVPGDPDLQLFEDAVAFRSAGARLAGTHRRHRARVARPRGSGVGPWTAVAGRYSRRGLTPRGRCAWGADRPT